LCDVALRRSATEAKPPAVVATSEAMSLQRLGISDVCLK
jgi:hypothetical protein